MNIIDIVFAVILIFGLVQGLRKGFFVELASLVGLVAGVYGAVHFSYFVGDWLVTKTSWSEQVIKLSAFAITFIIIVILVSMAGKALTKVADFAMLGIVNKILGGVFSLLKYAFILSAVLMFLNAANDKVVLVSQETIEESILYEPVQIIAPTVLPAILNAGIDNTEEASSSYTNSTIK